MSDEKKELSGLSSCSAIADERLFSEVCSFRTAMECSTIEEARNFFARDQAARWAAGPKVDRVPGAAAKLDDYQLLMALICGARCPQHANVVLFEVLPELERRLAAANVVLQCECGKTSMRSRDAHTLGAAAPFTSTTPKEPT